MGFAAILAENQPPTAPITASSPIPGLTAANSKTGGKPYRS